MTPEKCPFDEALKAYIAWLESERQIFKINGEISPISVDGETMFIKRSDCQKLADHGDAIRTALITARDAGEATAEQQAEAELLEGMHKS